MHVHLTPIWGLSLRHILKAEGECPSTGFAMEEQAVPQATGSGCHKILSLLGRWKEGTDCQNQVEGAQEESFEPGGFPVQADECVESGHQAKHRYF